MMGGAAFFDVDKTLLPGVSAEMLLVRGLLKGTIPGRFQSLPFLVEWLRLLPQGITVARKANKAYLAGAQPDEVRAWARKLFDEQITPRLGLRAGEWIALERARGRAIVLLSGMPDLLLEPFAERFRSDLAIGTPLEVGASGRLTGRRAGLHPYGAAKLAIARAIVDDRGWDPIACSAYGDHASDAYLLAWVGEAFAVDPDERLRREAVRRGWTILD
jgi:putative phosphoserine phosphatase/1-acylglycerol-3-phosphate O-acyltransferase